MATHTKTVTDDITAALIEHARSSIQYEKQLLRELESLRGDVNTANQKVAPPKPNGYPKPAIVLPLEDDTLPKVRPPIPRPSSGFPASTPPATQTMFRPHSATPQSSSAGPSTVRGPTAPSSAPISPLSQRGRFGDGTQSMFVKPTPTFRPSGAGRSSSSSSSLPQGPLGGIAQTSAPTSPPPNHPLPGTDPLSVSAVASTNTQQVVDPLAYLTPANMSQSMRVQPSRPRLDARVAASKLANMF